MALFGFGRGPSAPSVSGKPVGKTPQKPAPPAPKPGGIFGEKKYRTFTNLKEFARKAPFKPAPGFGKPWGKERRTGLVEKMKKYSGKSYGVGEKDFPSIIRKMEKEKMYTKDYAKKKVLQEDIAKLKQWQKEGKG